MRRLSLRPSTAAIASSAGATFSWRSTAALKLYERVPWKPLRQRALRQAQNWLLEHLERSDGLGAIYPAMMNSIFALLALGYSPDDPLTAREIGQLAQFEIEDGETIRVAAVRLAGLGHGDCHGVAGRSGARHRTIPRWSVPANGCWRIRFSVQATGR